MESNANDLLHPIEYEETEEYFGKEIGVYQFYQVPYHQFQLNCLSVNSVLQDSTGKRLYAGGHVGIRFLRYLCAVLEKKSVLELGCGTGIIGLSLFFQTEHTPSNLLLTDGSASTLRITEQNIVKIFSPLCPPPSTFSTAAKSIGVELLSWGNEDHSSTALARNDGKPYDTVIGCELMYYNTDVALLLSTVKRLLHEEEGIFIHVHHFRKDHQEQQVIDECTRYNWITVEIPKILFIEKEELTIHPEWYCIRALLTGKKDYIEKVLDQYNISGRIFQPELLEEDDCDKSEGEDESLETSIVHLLFKESNP